VLVDTRWAEKLLHLNLSYNDLGSGGTAKLADYLAIATALQVLKVPGCLLETKKLLETVVQNEALSAGIHDIDLSYNKCKSGGKTLLPLVAAIANNTRASLQAVSVVGIGIVSKELCVFLEALAKHSTPQPTFDPISGVKLRHAEGVRLHLAQNRLGKKAVFAEHLHNARVHTLNLSMCGLGAEGVEAVAQALLGNGTLRTLNLGGNVAPGAMGGTKKLAAAAAAISALLLPSSGTQLEALHVAGGEDFYFKEACVPIVEALAENTTLVELVITGNKSGPDLASALGAVLRTNRTLASVMWDYNQIKSSGYRAFLEGLKTNKTLTLMPAPMMDVLREQRKSKKHAAEVRALWDEIDTLITTNQEALGKPRRGTGWRQADGGGHEEWESTSASDDGYDSD
jgi:hypothetical protein